MKVDVQINNSAQPSARYVSWAPSVCTLRVTDPEGAGGASVPVTLANAAATGGQVVFYSALTASPRPSLELTVPLSGQTVRFWIAGKFGRPSVADRDAAVRVTSGGKLVADVPLMVRVRKDANTLTAGERDRFIAAFARLNNQGLGRFADFRIMHTNAASPEAHGAPAFLPWHRAYLLDLERELQAIDPSVALPYWRFDRKAPKLFTPEFIGESDANGVVHFSATNPLQFWRTDGVQGISRRPLFDPKTDSAIDVLTEKETLTTLGATYEGFQAIEGNPHGYAHVSFGGSISSIPTAARDPLFFLLHANVDRLWAKWQKRVGAIDASNAASYDSNLPAGNRIGHNLTDTMWPWNGVVTPPRPATAPGGTLAASPCTNAPGPSPRVRDLIDFQGALAAHAGLGFDYDDVRFA